MSKVTINGKECTAYYGDHKEVTVYNGSTKLYGAESQTKTGSTVVFDDTYNGNGVESLTLTGSNMEGATTGYNDFAIPSTKEFPTTHESGTRYYSETWNSDTKEWTVTYHANGYTGTTGLSYYPSVSVFSSNYVATTERRAVDNLKWKDKGLKLYPTTKTDFDDLYVFVAGYKTGTGSRPSTISGNYGNHIVVDGYWIQGLHEVEADNGYTYCVYTNVVGVSSEQTLKYVSFLVANYNSTDYTVDATWKLSYPCSAVIKFSDLVENGLDITTYNTRNLWFDNTGKSYSLERATDIVDCMYDANLLPTYEPFTGGLPAPNQYYPLTESVSLNTTAENCFFGGTYNRSDTTWDADTHTLTVEAPSSNAIYSWSCVRYYSGTDGDVYHYKDVAIPCYSNMTEWWDADDKYIMFAGWTGRKGSSYATNMRFRIYRSQDETTGTRYYDWVQNESYITTFSPVIDGYNYAVRPVCLNNSSYSEGATRLTSSVIGIYGAYPNTYWVENPVLKLVKVDDTLADYLSEVCDHTKNGNNVFGQNKDIQEYIMLYLRDNMGVNIQYEDYYNGTYTTSTVTLDAPHKKADFVTGKIVDSGSTTGKNLFAFESKENVVGITDDANNWVRENNTLSVTHATDAPSSPSTIFNYYTDDMSFEFLGTNGYASKDDDDTVDLLCFGFKGRSNVTTGSSFDNHNLLISPMYGSDSVSEFRCINSWLSNDNNLYKKNGITWVAYPCLIKASSTAYTETYTCKKIKFWAYVPWANDDTAELMVEEPMIVKAQITKARFKELWFDAGHDWDNAYFGSELTSKSSAVSAWEDIVDQLPDTYEPFTGGLPAPNEYYNSDGTVHVDGSIGTQEINWSGLSKTSETAPFTWDSDTKTFTGTLITGTTGGSSTSVSLPTSHTLIPNTGWLSATSKYVVLVGYTDRVLPFDTNHLKGVFRDNSSNVSTSAFMLTTAQVSTTMYERNGYKYHVAPFMGFANATSTVADRWYSYLYRTDTTSDGTATITNPILMIVPYDSSWDVQSSDLVATGDWTKTSELGFSAFLTAKCKEIIDDLIDNKGYDLTYKDYGTYNSFDTGVYGDCGAITQTYYPSVTITGGDPSKTIKVSDTSDD